MRDKHVSDGGQYWRNKDATGGTEPLVLEPAVRAGEGKQEVESTIFKDAADSM